MTEAGRLHPLTLVFEALRVARAFLLPAVIGGASVGGGDFGGVFRWAVALMAVPALLGAAAKYVSFRYRLGAAELIIDSGLLSRQRRVIPLSRVQHIDVRQTAMQRAAGVAELRVETAGGDATEAVLSVLELRDAESLRAELLARRGHDRDATPHTEAAPIPLARLSTGDLALAGATANEIGLVAAVLGGAFNLMMQLGLEPPTPDVDVETWLPQSPAAAIAVVTAFLVLVFLIVGWCLSVVGSVVRYHGFTLERAGDELRKRFGLLSRQEATVPLHRVQTIRVEESLLRRAFGLAALKVETAGGIPGQDRRGGAEAFVPLVRGGAVGGLVRSIVPTFHYERVTFLPVHPRSRWRAFVRNAVPLAALAIGLGLWRGPGWFWGLALLPVVWLLAHAGYRNRGYARVPGFVVARSGVLNRITRVVPNAKIQTMHTAQTPLQRRHRLADLVVDTAGGQAVVIDLHQDDARRLLIELAAELPAGRNAAAADRTDPPVPAG